MGLAVRLAVARTGTVCFQLAVLADEAVLLGALFEVKLLFAVNHASEVWLFAFIALIKSA